MNLILIGFPYSPLNMTSEAWKSYFLFTSGFSLGLFTYWCKAYINDKLYAMGGFEVIVF